MKTLILALLATTLLAVAGCSCDCASHYPKNTFIGSSGWPASQVPMTRPAE